MVKYIIPLEGDGIVEPFKPAFLDEAPPGIHYDLPNNVAVFDPDKAVEMVEALKADEKTTKILKDKIKKAVKALEKLAEEGKVKVEE
jgi:hypothetical protein